MARRPGSIQGVEGPPKPTLPLGSMPPHPRRGINLDLNFDSILKSHQKEQAETDSKFNEITNCSGKITIDERVYKTDIDELEHLGELGNGTCGHVVKMRHKPTDSIIAVKQMRRSGNTDDNKRIIMDLEVVLQSHDCPFIVKCLGCFITDSDVWICMELMATCMDKLLKRVKEPIPEIVLGKVAVATVKALHYLKEKHGVIHRDVKPSNILLDEKGNFKLCDFGISGRLVDSKAKTRSAGCTAYMAPERIDPPDPSRPNYDIRADVWSLGITLVELATGKFPYGDCSTDFEVMTRILQDDPPSLPADRKFSLEFRSFVSDCLAKDYKHRPKYKHLLNHSFILKSEQNAVNVNTYLNMVCGTRSVHKYTSSSSFPSNGGRSSGRMLRSSTSGSTGSTASNSSVTLSPSPSSSRPSRYEDFSIISPRGSGGWRMNFDRLNSEPLPNVRTPSTPGTPSPNTGIPPDPPPRFSRMSGSDGLRTPTNSSSSSSGNNLTSPSSLSVTNSTPSPTEGPAPPIRSSRLRTMLLCYPDSC